MGDTGLEQPHSFPGKTAVGAERGNKSGNKSGNISGGDDATAAGEPPTDPMLDSELTAVVRAWGVLPGAVRAGIVAMVRASSSATASGEDSR